MLHTGIGLCRRNTQGDHTYILSIKSRKELLAKIDDREITMYYQELDLERLKLPLSTEIVVIFVHIKILS